MKTFFKKTKVISLLTLLIIGAATFKPFGAQATRPVQTFCTDRPDQTNNGYCTRDLDYWPGGYFCVPGGYSCDGQA